MNIDFAFFLVLFSYSQYCSTVTSVRDGCLFSYFTDPECTHFQFQYCADSQSNFTKLTTCMDIFCFSTDLLDFPSSILYCKNNNSGSHSFSIFIVVIYMILGILALVALYGVYQMVRQHKNKLNLVKFHEVNFPSDFSDIAWVYPSQKIMRNNCPICLNSGADLQTECGHDCHRECLINWFSDHGAICPSCMKTKLSQFRCFCQLCNSSYVSLNRKFLNEWIAPLKCQKCRDENSEIFLSS